MSEMAQWYTWRRDCPPAVVAFALGAAMALLFSAGAEAESEASRVETFSGICNMSGVIRHDPALTNEPAPTQVRGVFRGTCSGRLTNQRGHARQLDGVRSAYKARPAGELSCLGGTAIGNGRLIIGRRKSDRRKVIKLSLTERRTPGVAEVMLEGAAGGSGSVTGTVSAEEFVAAGERCSASGLRRLRGDGRITSPGISG